jgi:hypothetical protein
MDEILKQMIADILSAICDAFGKAVAAALEVMIRQLVQAGWVKFA